jgi:hypothetical protein
LHRTDNVARYLLHLAYDFFAFVQWTKLAWFGRDVPPFWDQKGRKNTKIELSHWSVGLKYERNLTFRVDTEIRTQLNNSTLPPSNNGY